MLLENSQKEFIRKSNNESDFITYNFECTTLDVPKRRRGPKKKPITQERVVKLRQRRVRANARERSRMHGLNNALDTLRTNIPLALINKLPECEPQIRKLKDSALRNALSTSALLCQRLSKIETLRLARNYIHLLIDMLKQPNETDKPFTREMVLEMLCRGISQITANQIAILLGLNPIVETMISQYSMFKNWRYSTTNSDEMDSTASNQSLSKKNNFEQRNQDNVHDGWMELKTESTFSTEFPQDVYDIISTQQSVLGASDSNTNIYESFDTCPFYTQLSSSSEEIPFYLTSSHWQSSEVPIEQFHFNYTHC